MTGVERGFVWFLALSALVASLAGCAGGPDAPSWVKGKPKGYPAKHYTWGVASGVDASRAADAAIAELGRKSGGETESATIERTWLDERKRVHWALAVLDRTALAQRLQTDWAAADAETAQLLASDVEGAPPSQVLPAVVRAIERASVRDALGARIGRLTGTPPPVDPSRERARLDERLAAFKRATAIDVEAWEMDPQTGSLGEPLEQIRTALAQAVLARGFRVASHDDWSPSASWLLIRAQVGIEPLELGGADRFTAVEWNAVVEVRDRTGEGEVLAIQTKKARATHLNVHEARREALAQAGEFVSTSFSAWLDERLPPPSAAPSATPAVAPAPAASPAAAPAAPPPAEPAAPTPAEPATQPPTQPPAEPHAENAAAPAENA